VANNGFLLSDMDDSHILDCFAYNVGGTPAFGLQLKNVCTSCSIRGGGADNCVKGAGFGNDLASTGVTNSIVSDVYLTGNVTAFLGAYCENNDISLPIVDMESAVENGVDLQDGAIGNSVSIKVAKNINASRSAIRLRSGATDNSVRVGVLENINTSAALVTCDSGAEYNYITLDRMTTPRTKASGELFSFTGDYNHFIYNGEEEVEYLTLATNVATARNMATKVISLNVESGTTDNLDTLTIGTNVEGKTIILKAVNSANTIVCKHATGNLVLAGGADFSLTERRDSIMLVCFNGEWCEISRSDNLL
jgi:hypothetical protein